MAWTIFSMLSPRFHANRRSRRWRQRMKRWWPVRVLLDEQLPRQLAREFPSHEVRTVQQQGWAGLKNGELLRRAAEAGFEVFVTTDQNLEFQQNLARSPLF